MLKLLLVYLSMVVLLTACSNEASTSANQSSSITLPDYFEVTAWVGEDDAEITISQGTTALDDVEFYRSNDINCDITNYSICTNGQLDFLTSANESILDTSFNLTNSSFATFKRLETQVEKIISHQHFSQRRRHKTIVFKEELWLFGGVGSFSDDKDIWSSSDGRNWVKKEGEASYGSLVNRNIIEFNNALWLIGSGEVWTSTDAINWTQAETDSSPPVSYSASIVEFKNKLWLISKEEGEKKNSVWSSSDAKSWSKVENANDLYVAYGHELIVFNNKLWLIAGYDHNDDPLISDLWYSHDGISWLSSSMPNTFTPRAGHRVAEFNNQIWIVGGYDYGDGWTAGDVWSSKNGTDWVKKQDAYYDSFANRYDHQILVFQDKLLVIGGEDIITYNNDVWATYDMKSWELLNTTAPFIAAADHNLIEFNNKLWLYGGHNGWTEKGLWNSDDGINWVTDVSMREIIGYGDYKLFNLKDKLWLIGSASGNPSGQLIFYSSADGLKWVQEEIEADIRMGLEQAIEFNDKMYIFGAVGGSYPKSAWVSDDGTHWQESRTYNYPSRFDGLMIEFADKLWVIGGDGGYANTNDIWSSIDGLTWIEEKSYAEFSQRKGHQIVNLNEKLWLFFGDDGTSFESETKDDVWYSDNAIDWVRYEGEISIPHRSGHSMITFKEKVFLLGGRTHNEFLSDVWSSPDAKSWRKAYKTKIEFPKQVLTH